MKTVKNSSGASYALVTGASQGIGKCIARDLAQRGFNLVLVALPTPELKETQCELRRAFDVDVKAIGIDLTQEKAPHTVFEKFRRLGVPISVLVNNAGIGYLGRFEDNPLPYYLKLIKLNAIATIQLTYLFLPVLRKSPESYILNMGSLASLFPIPFKSVYVASKQFVRGFSLSLREELKRERISVTTVCPNAVLTNQMHSESVRSVGWLAKIAALQPEQVAKESIRSMFQGKRVYIPGLASRLYQLLRRFLPYEIMMSMVRRQMLKILLVRHIQTGS